MGANSIEAAIYGIAPQIKPAFVGAGGIGVELQNSINTFQWQGVLTILLAILAIVIFSEIVSAYLRRKVR